MRLFALCLVYELIAQELDDLELGILYLADIHEVGVVCDKSGIAFTCSKKRMVQHVQHEGQVGLYALDAGLTESTDGFDPCLVEGVAESSDLYKK